MKKCLYWMGYFATGWLILAGLAGCGGEEQTGEVIEDVKVDTAASNVLQVGNEVFCIPSPIQSAILVKQVGASYMSDMLNPVSNKNGYSTNYQKALNLGVYGADLGYTTIYEQPQSGLNYLNAVKDMADDIGVSSAFSTDIIERITKNLGNQDSLLGMVSVCYRQANAYLQENDRKDVCALILAGGWIESLYFVTHIAGTMENQQIVNRIGEQKETLNNLIKLIEPFYNDPQYTELLDMFYDLALEFDQVQLKYVYKEPSVDEQKKITVINSLSEVVISPDQVSRIAEKVKTIRGEITG